MTSDNYEDEFDTAERAAGVPMVDPNTNGDEPRLALTGGGSSARVVLAEVDAPGSLHYLLEAEGFQVVGCAGDDEELGRVLGQRVDPDVIVLDADVVATASLVARRLAPDAHLIAVWPDAVQPPPGGERVNPRMVYEELGPAIRRHMDRRSAAVPVIALPADEPAMASVAVGTAAALGGGVTSVGEPSGAPSGAFTRAASRMSVLSVTLITAILLTMGVSFALGGFRSGPLGGPPRLFVPGSSSDGGGVSGGTDPFTGRVRTAGSGLSGNPSKKGSNGPRDHHQTPGSLGDLGVTTGGGGGDSTGDQTGGATGDTTGNQGGSGDSGAGQGDQGGGSGDQGGGGQGDQGGGGQGDQGGGQGDQGGGGQGDQGGGQGDQGGGGQGDQGGGGQGDHGDGQGDGGDGQHGGGGAHGDEGDGDDEDDQGGGHGDEGDQDGDDQGDNDQGDRDSHGDHGSHGDGHGGHSHDHGQNDQAQLL